MFDTLQIQRSNKVQALHTPCALGYTAFDEMHCSDLVAAGRADSARSSPFSFALYVSLPQNYNNL